MPSGRRSLAGGRAGTSSGSMPDGAARAVPQLTVYGRAYCHLCEDMIAALSALQAEHRFSFVVVDVDADPSLEARYDELVPVLVCDGDEVCRHFLDRERLKQVLAAAKPAAIC